MSPFGISFEFSFLFFHFPLLILSLNGSVRASWLREGAGGKPARAQAVGGAGGKKSALLAGFELTSSLFCRLASPRLVPADL
jgi:hypothetical protein